MKAIDYQVMPELTAEEYAELKADIQERGVMVAIEFDENGNILDGYNRYKICQELGIKDYPRVIRAGMTENQKFTHARKLNLARRHLNREQWQRLIAEEIKAKQTVIGGNKVLTHNPDGSSRVYPNTEEQDSLLFAINRYLIPDFVLKESEPMHGWESQLNEYRRLEQLSLFA